MKAGITNTEEEERWQELLVAEREFEVAKKTFYRALRACVGDDEAETRFRIAVALTF